MTVLTDLKDDWIDFDLTKTKFFDRELELKIGARTDSMNKFLTVWFAFSLFKIRTQRQMHAPANSLRIKLIKELMSLCPKGNADQMTLTHAHKWQ